MVRIAFLVSLLAGCGLLLGAASAAFAGPLTVAVPAVSPSAVEKAGWRRYCRRYGCGPDVAYPNVEVVPGAVTDIEADVPAVVVLPPPRPLSCGQYRYWDGDRCVDARYTDPYLGPK